MNWNQCSKKLCTWCTYRIHMQNSEINYINTTILSSSVESCLWLQNYRLIYYSHVDSHSYRHTVPHSSPAPFSSSRHSQGTFCTFMSQDLPSFCLFTTKWLWTRTLAASSVWHILPETWWTSQEVWTISILYNKTWISNILFHANSTRS